MLSVGHYTRDYPEDNKHYLFVEIGNDYTAGISIKKEYDNNILLSVSVTYSVLPYAKAEIKQEIETLYDKVVQYYDNKIPFLGLPLMGMCNRGIYYNLSNERGIRKC